MDIIDSEELIEYMVWWFGYIDRYLSGNDFEDELIEVWKFDILCFEFIWLVVEVLVINGIRRWDVIDEGKSEWFLMVCIIGLVIVEVVEMLVEGLILESGVMFFERLGEEFEFINRLLEVMIDVGV